MKRETGMCAPNVSTEAFFSETSLRMILQEKREDYYDTSSETTMLKYFSLETD